MRSCVWRFLGILQLVLLFAASCFGTFLFTSGAEASTVYVDRPSAKIYSSAGQRSFNIRVIQVVSEGDPLTVMAKKTVAGAEWLHVKTAANRLGWIQASSTTEQAPASARGDDESATLRSFAGPPGGTPNVSSSRLGTPESRTTGDASQRDPSQTAPQSTVDASNTSDPPPGGFGPTPPKFSASIKERIDRFYEMKAREQTSGEGISIETQDQTYRPYFNDLLKLIGKKFQYPVDAYLARLEGRVFLKFVLKKDGVLRGIHVITSSGFDLLDNAAIKSIDDAAPFPPFAVSIKEDELTITIDFLFAPEYPETGPKIVEGGENFVDEVRGYK